MLLQCTSRRRADCNEPQVVWTFTAEANDFLSGVKHESTHSTAVGDMEAKGAVSGMLLEGHDMARDQGTESTYSKEVGDMIAEGAVVGVLLQGHDLDGVVAQLADAGQHGHAEVQVAVHARLLAGHADVALVDAQCPGPALHRQSWSW